VTVNYKPVSVYTANSKLLVLRKVEQKRGIPVCAQSFVY